MRSLLPTANPTQREPLVANHFMYRLFSLFLDLLATITIRAPSPRPGSRLAEGVSEGRIKESIYVASIHWNTEHLLRSHWTDALVELVKECDDVYVSVYESGSWDDTKGALRELDARLEELGVERRIVCEERTHEDEVDEVPAEDQPGWIWTPSGFKALRRIPYLAKTRNRAMEDLQTLSTRAENPRIFDKILWLNDVIFTVSDIKALLQTNSGHFSAACALDFTQPPKFYDSFAMRDIDGNPALSLTWPYFLSPVSRKAVMKGEDVPVRSCWNGMAIFDAWGFYADGGREGVRFRGIEDNLAGKHVEGSECCLVHADLRDKENDNGNGREGAGIWVNQNVRVAYNEGANKVVNRGKDVWSGRWGRVSGVWLWRWSYWWGWLDRRKEKRKIEKRVSEWRREVFGRGIAGEVGVECLVDEMQILLANGWEHV